MNLVALHVAPLWQETDGSRTVGVIERRDHPSVVGWCCAARIQIGREVRWFLLALDAA